MAHPHSPDGARRKTSAPVPAARFFARPSYEKASPKNDAATDLRQINPVWRAGLIMVQWRRTKERTDGKIKKEAERRQTRVYLLHRKAQRAPCRARSPVGVPRRFCPWDSRIPRCGVGPGFAALVP